MEAKDRDTGRPYITHKEVQDAYQAGLQTGLQAGGKAVIESFEMEVKHHSNPELRRRAFEEVLTKLKEEWGL